MNPTSRSSGDDGRTGAPSDARRRDAVADALSPRARAKGGDPQAHTRVVNLAKVALPALAAAVLGLIAVWPLFSGPGEVRQAGPESGKLEMVDARFIGSDTKERPFEVRAERVLQPGGGQPVELVRPQAEITLPGGEWVTVSAQSGRYDQDKGLLTLAGGVTLYHDGGYEFVTEDARVDVKAGVAWGEAPVRGLGPIGEIDAGGFRIEDEGDTVIFTGRARMKLVDTTTKEPG